ncbi:MAG: cyclic nucleotide-binding domain-containing protein [Granulosicoccaceae bacterium]
MAEAAIKPDLYLLQRLQPLTSLPVATLQQLSGQAHIEMVADGEYIFERGTHDTRVLYLLQGNVEILTGEDTHLLTHTSPLARQPVSVYSPRPVSARAKGRCSLLVIDGELLSTAIAAQETGYDVEELDIVGDAHTFTHLLKTPDLLKLPPDDMSMVLGNLERVEVEAGEVILWQGDNDPWYYILLTGTARVSRLPDTGAREITLAELRPGCRFGEEALITGQPRNATITMISNGSLLRLHGDIFRHHVVAPFVPQLDENQAHNLVRRGSVLIDVRSENEHRANGLGLNIPLPMLRLKMNRIDPDKPCIFVCDNGRLSQAAAFVVRQQGLDARIVRGGIGALQRLQDT